MHWIISRHIPAYLRHYLDNFLPIFPLGIPTQLAEVALEWIQALGSQLGLSFQQSKTEGPIICLTFLGLEIDMVVMKAYLPNNKLVCLHLLLLEWLQCLCCSLRELQKLIGLLHFASTVVPYSQAFIHCLINFSTQFLSQLSTRHISHAAQADIAWWFHFVRDWNSIYLIILSCSILHIYSDASGSKGIGAIFGNR